MTFNLLRRARLVFVLFAVAFAAGCSKEGSRFNIAGPVTRAGNESITITVETIEIDDAGWFTRGDSTRVHDNCDCHGFWDSRKTYGTVFDEDGTVIEPNEVDVGACVRFTGQIREDADGKHRYDRPVFDEAHVFDC